MSGMDDDRLTKRKMDDQETAAHQSQFFLVQLVVMVDNTYITRDVCRKLARPTIVGWPSKIGCQQLPAFSHARTSNGVSRHCRTSVSLSQSNLPDDNSGKKKVKPVRMLIALFGQVLRPHNPHSITPSSCTTNHSFATTTTSMPTPLNTIHGGRLTIQYNTNGVQCIKMNKALKNSHQI